MLEENKVTFGDYRRISIMFDWKGFARYDQSGRSFWLVM
jgi:hypothetical protein